MNDRGDDAQPDLPAHERRRLQTSRLIQYLLLQAVISAACVLALLQSLPSPPAEYQVTAFILTEGGAGRAVMLPYFSSLRNATNDPPRFDGHFVRPAGEAAEAWSVYLPRFTNGVEVTVNGVVVLDSRRDPAANRPDRNTPAIAVIPASLLRDGENAITIRLFIWGPITGFLDRLYVGPDQLLRPSYDLRTLIFVTLPVVFSSWQAILAVILGIMWVMRRHEPAYGVLAAAMAVGVGQAFLQTPMGGETPLSKLNVIVISSAPIESALVLTFALLLSGWKWQRYGWLMFLPGILLALAGVFGNQALVRALFLILAVPMVGLSLVIMAIVIARSALKRPNMASFLLGCAVTIMLTCWISDLLAVFQLVPNRIFVSRLSYSVMLVAIGAGLTWRFARALNQVDGFAGRLVTQVREAEEKLKASFAREEERARAAALARERTRLMRDLHDGLGGQLVSIVALSERGNGSEGIGEAARAALKDLRLVIDSMDDIGGDLMLALGSWRERAMAQLRPHDIALDWRAVTPQGVPVHPELRPWHVIQIVRLLDEAVTNAVKHAAAKRVTVRIETLTDEDGLDRGCITVEDDGKGFEIAPDGGATGAAKAARGLRNMRSRAARCGAELDLSSCAHGPDRGTHLRLILPHRFPDSDAATG
ncbi:sensor histidine kinase [Bradyrhizobium sp. BWA-3-5]|uniref:sensor histidine kinase n=1 Tax=Bradyrhizobium sp. BWA-3-5 TaxID=3080013 RepID=UPI00293F3474|nr:ATP-binding protein [Bradyrhizobium sp. BWA-3-5]WOH67003.1 ATP-binding protein [Bradyrhizobium sp. BWA-3-5]